MCDPSGPPYFSTALRIPAFRKRNAFFVFLFVCFEESKILGFGVRNSAQGLRNSVIDWNPGSIISGAHNLWGSWLSGIGIQYPRLSWVSRTWGSVYSKNVRTMCERIKRLLDSDNRGGTLKEEGEGGGGVKTFFSWKKGKFWPRQNYTQNRDILRKNPLTILLFTYHSLQIKFVNSWKGWQPKCHAIRRATKLAVKGMQWGGGKIEIGSPKKTSPNFCLCPGAKKLWLAGICP